MKTIQEIFVANNGYISDGLASISNKNLGKVVKAIIDQQFEIVPAIQLTSAEIQSGSDRVKWAESLILQLPETHDGRNSWLINYGRSYEAARLREQWEKTNSKTLEWDENTISTKPIS